MRLRALIGLLLIGLGVAPVLAAPLPNELFKGTVSPTFTRNNLAWCSADLGPTQFLRNGTARPLISFPGINYAEFTADGANYYTLSGESRMLFSGANLGTIKFDRPMPYPDAVLEAPFSNYVETYDSARRRLMVEFRINFAMCTLKVSTIYWY